MVVAVALAAVLGAAVGSFLSVVAHRVPLGESIVAPRSACPACGTQLRARDNVPILSWVVLRGRCAHCGASVSARYPALEALTAVVFAAVVAVGGVDLDLVYELPFCAMLIAVAAIDLEHTIVPNVIVAPAAVYGLAAVAAVRTEDLPEHALAGIAAFAVLLAAALIAPAGMGMGDVKLAGVMGIFLGLEVVPALLFAFLAGSVVGVGLILASGGGERRRGIPFAPFLAFGGVVGVLAGHGLLELYSNQFLS